MLTSTKVVVTVYENIKGRNVRIEAAVVIRIVFFLLLLFRSVVSQTVVRIPLVVLGLPLVVVGST